MFLRVILTFEVLEASRIPTISFETILISSVEWLTVVFEMSLSLTLSFFSASDLFKKLRNPGNTLEGAKVYEFIKRLALH